MAGNKVLQILRGNNSVISSSTDTLLPGQPLYNVDRKYLIVGDNSDTQIQNAEPITTNRLISYNESGSVASLQLDSDGNIVASGNSIQLKCNDSSISLDASGLSSNVANITSAASIINFTQDVTISRGDNANIILDEGNLQITIPSITSSVQNITSTASIINFTSEEGIVSPTLTSTGNFTVDSDNIYLGSSKIGNVHIKGVLDVDGNLQVDSNATLAGTLNVTGITTLSTLEATSISSNKDISTPNLTVNSGATINGLKAPSAVLNTPEITGGKINNSAITGGSAKSLTAVSTDSLTIGSWTITTSGNNLRFTYNSDSSNYVEFEAFPCAIDVHHS